MCTIGGFVVGDLSPPSVLAASAGIGCRADQNMDAQDLTDWFRLDVEHSGLVRRPPTIEIAG